MLVNANVCHIISYFRVTNYIGNGLTNTVLVRLIEINARRKALRIVPYYLPRAEALKPREIDACRCTECARYAARYLLYLSPAPIRNYI